MRLIARKDDIFGVPKKVIKNILLFLSDKHTFIKTDKKTGQELLHSLYKSHFYLQIFS